MGTKLAMKDMTKADAAKLVHRMIAKTDDAGNVIRDKEGNPVGKPGAVKADEVMDFAVYADKIVVVTTSGEKLAYEWTAEERKSIAAVAK